MTPPLIPLPDTVLLHANPALLLELTQIYHDFHLPQEPVPAYHMTSYRDDDGSSMDSQFGVHVHHPWFLEWVGAPESASLLSHPLAEWLQVMNRQDTLHAALQLQRDANLCRPT